MKKIKLCIVTGSRAEWGLFYPLASEIEKNKDVFILQIIATAAHLCHDYGSTYKEIERDGFKINHKVKMLVKSDIEDVIARSVSLGITGLTEALKFLNPDLVFLLGDRFETFAAAVASFFLKIPIAHIHGGELTQGSLDDSLRHAITKMAYLHFVSTDTYRNRVIQMGEEPSRVFNVGALAIDNIRNTKLLNKNEFEKVTNIKLGKKNIMVTYNPPTIKKKSFIEKEFKNLLKAIDEFKDAKIIFTRPNFDMHSKMIVRLINSFVQKNKNRCWVFTSMGRIKYLSALQFMDVVVGNSSSGIIEVPYFNYPTVDIGNRQRGRVKSASIITSDGTLKSIRESLIKAFSSDHRKLCKTVRNFYGKGNVSKKIVEIIKTIPFSDLSKKFYNIDINILSKNIKNDSC